MTEPFLILHRVRGEPAFDIAEKIGEDSDGDIWIIPTSGHRAYPFNSWNLNKLAPADSIDRDGDYDLVTENLALPPDWPDHYACNDRPATSTAEHKSFAKGLLEKLGLVKPTRVERRF